VRRHPLSDGYFFLQLMAVSDSRMRLLGAEEIQSLTTALIPHGGRESFRISEICRRVLECNSMGGFISTPGAYYSLRGGLDKLAPLSKDPSRQRKFSKFRNKHLTVIAFESDDTEYERFWKLRDREDFKHTCLPAHGHVTQSDVHSLHAFVALHLHSLHIRPGIVLKGPSNAWGPMHGGTSNTNSPAPLRTDLLVGAESENPLRGISCATTRGVGFLKPATLSNTMELLKTRFDLERARSDLETGVLNRSLNDVRQKLRATETRGVSIATDRTRSIKNSIDHDTVSFELCVARDAYTAAREARLFLIQRLRSDFVSAVAEKNRVLKQNRALLIERVALAHEISSVKALMQKGNQTQLTARKGAVYHAAVIMSLLEQRLCGALKELTKMCQKNSKHEQKLLLRRTLDTNIWQKIEVLQKSSYTLNLAIAREAIVKRRVDNLRQQNTNLQQEVMKVSFLEEDLRRMRSVLYKTELDHRTRARESKMLTIFAKEKNIPEEISGQGRLNPEMSSPLKDKARAEFRRFRHL